MFVALEPVRQESNSLRSIFDRMAGPKAWLEARSACGADFVVIKARIGKKGPDWEQIRQLAGRYADRMLLPDSLLPPEDSLIRQPLCATFDKQVLVHTACEIIQRTRIPMYRRVAGLIDLDGNHADMLFRLLKYYTSVRVVTNNFEKYFIESERMMEELGAPVLVGEELRSLEDCVLVVLPQSIPEMSGKPPCPVLAGEQALLPSRWNIAAKLRPPPPAQLLSCCPAGIDPYRLMGALYEFCGVQSLPLVAEHILFNYKVSALSEVVQAVTSVIR